MSAIFYGAIFLLIQGASFFGATTTSATASPSNQAVSSELFTGDKDVKTIAGEAPDRAVTGSHAGRFTVYEGTRTCLSCHETEAKEVHSSVHYQWQGDASKTVGLDTPKAGKLGGINDFCGYPDINWIGKLTTVNGNQVDGGCAKCHVGLGEKPSSEPVQSQLENIDCLICHSETYKRKVDMVDGSFRFIPDTNNMTVTLLQAAVDLKSPGNDSCLNCHAFAGGGNNFKRGDLEDAHRNPGVSLDVHMASTSDGGAGLKCLDCHSTTSHQIPGRGTDLRPLEGAGEVSCTNCHGEWPHDNGDLDKHTARLSCTVCHIPIFAKTAPTDMDRDWSHSGVLVEEKGLYEPYHQQGQNVQPVYRFFNGLSYFYQFGEPVRPGTNGRVLMAAPLGDIHDPGAKILAFKHHQATLPIDPDNDRLLPMKIGMFFQTGQVDQAIAAGTGAVGWEYNGHEFIPAERYMGLFHEVSPKSQALSCSSCHDQGTRLDFASLGYTPKTTYNNKPLCAACHKDESGEWDQNEFFEKVHKKHVKDKKFDCISCHTFSSVGKDSPGPPRAKTVIATAINDISAKLHGTVHPNGRTTTAVYEYGTDTTYGNSVTTTQNPLSGTSSQAVNAALSNLTPDTIYHFRIKATSSDGTDFGENRTFTTQTGTASCPDCSGASVVLENVTFSTGPPCECVCTESLTIGPGVTIKNGAQVTFDAPRIRVTSPFHAEQGALVKMGK